MGVGFRYLLALENGEPADPAAFITALPSWEIGDTFLAGGELQRFRILAIDAVAASDWNGIWTVEPVGE